MHGNTSPFIPGAKDSKSKRRVENFLDNLNPWRNLCAWITKQPKDLRTVTKESIQSCPWRSVSIENVFVIFRHVTDFVLLDHEKVSNQVNGEPGARRYESKSFPSNNISRTDELCNYVFWNQRKMNEERRVKIARGGL
jgi:hypothetical protein